MKNIDDSILLIDHLCVDLSRRKILDDVCLRVVRGECHAITGPNGAGKTTLLRAILGELAHRGQIKLRFQGSGRIGYVPQSLRLSANLPLRVIDLLQLLLTDRPLFLRASREARAHFVDLLGQVGGEALLYRQVANLSGGELRRVLIAQALSGQPELLLLDEPASNVDGEGTAQLIELLRDIRQRENLTIVLIEHDLRFIQHLADRVTTINQRLIQTTAPPSVTDLGDPGTATTTN